MNTVDISSNFVLKLRTIIFFLEKKPNAELSFFNPLKYSTCKNVQAPLTFLKDFLDVYLFHSERAFVEKPFNL